MNEKGLTVPGMLAALALAGWVVLAVYAVIGLLPGNYWSLSPTAAWLALLLSILIFVLTIPGREAPFWAGGGGSALRAAYRGAGVVAIGVATLLGVGLKWHLVGTGVAAPPETAFQPPDSFVQPPAEPMREYAESLKFDNWTHGTADSGYLVDTSRGGLPIKARIAPELHANSNPHDVMEGVGPGHGRIVARITLDSSYPGLGLPAGTSYVWVDSIQRHDTTGTFRAFIIDPMGRWKRFPPNVTFKYLQSRWAFANYPMSRWLLHNSSCLNTACEAHGCCRTCE